ncbi:MAG: hypothetical protein COB62_04070 [Piscirickettsiaceae bacterium]|nr:MAG: hypothetical protein COB62_04070 [Piscirickettsiaceae bacterium]
MKLIIGLLFFITNAVYGHGNIDTKGGACTLKIGEEHAIHVTAYQPSTHEGEVFCQDAPDVVETTIVLDFMEEDLKKLPFALSIGYDNAGVVEPLAALPLGLFPRGSMLLNFTPKTTGKYRAKVMFLDKEGHDTSREFDFYIGEQSPNSREPSSAQQVVKWLVIALFALGAVYILYIKRVSRDRD